MRHFSSRLHENSENEVMVLFGGTTDTHPTDFELWVIYKHSWKTRGGTAGMPATKSVAVSRPIKFQESLQLRNTFFIGNLLYVWYQETLHYKLVV